MPITSEWRQLTKAIVHRPGPEIFRMLSLGATDNIMIGQELIGNQAPEEHDRFIEILQESGVEVLVFLDLLEEAIGNAKADVGFDLWIRENFPRAIPCLPNLLEEIHGASLIGADDLFYNANCVQAFAPIFPPLRWLMYVRDMVAMSPRGLIVCHSASMDRRAENYLAKFIFNWSSKLHDYPIAFDAIEQGVFVQGGDILVLDQNTLVMGIGNLTEERAAKAIAEKLDLAVIGVTLPPSGPMREGRGVYEGWNGLNTALLHLDSMLSIFGPNQVLGVPYLLEGSLQELDPLSQIIKGVGAELGSLGSDLLSALARTGWVIEFEAGTGSSRIAHCKLLDVLRGKGVEVTYVGGTPDRDHRGKAFC